MTDENNEPDMPSYKAFVHSYLAQAEDPDTDDDYRLVYASVATASAIMYLADVIEFHLGKAG